MCVCSWYIYTGGDNGWKNIIVVGTLWGLLLSERVSPEVKFWFRVGFRIRARISIREICVLVKVRRKK